MCSPSETLLFRGNWLNNGGDLHPRQKTLLDRITLSCQGGHQHHETGNSHHTRGVPFPDALARRVCRALLETTSGEDDHHKEVGVQETGEPAREVILNHSTLNQKSPRKSWNSGHDTHRAYTAAGDIARTSHWPERCVGREPNHSFSDLHETIMSRNPESTSSSSRKFGSHSSKVAEHSD